MNLLDIEIIGNATGGAEKKTAKKDGNVYATFRIAASDIDGKPQYAQVVVTGSQIESVLQYVKKGKPLRVTGSLTIAEDGFLKVFADRVVFLGGSAKQPGRDTLKATVEALADAKNPETAKTRK